MTLFIILALTDSEALVDTAVAQGFPDDSYNIEPGKWIVSGGLATTNQVYDKLELSEKAPHLILSIKGYYGRARPDLWEWLAAQSGKVDA